MTLNRTRYSKEVSSRFKQTTSLQRLLREEILRGCAWRPDHEEAMCSPLMNLRSRAFLLRQPPTNTEKQSQLAWFPPRRDMLRWPSVWLTIWLNQALYFWRQTLLFISSPHSALPPSERTLKRTVSKVRKSGFNTQLCGQKNYAQLRDESSGPGVNQWTDSSFFLFDRGDWLAIHTTAIWLARVGKVGTAGQQPS